MEFVFSNKRLNIPAYISYSSINGSAISMPVCFVLVRTTPAREQDVFDDLKNVGEIKYLHPLLGEYDFILKIEADDLKTIADIVIDKIRQIDGIEDTTTWLGCEL